MSDFSRLIEIFEKLVSFRTVTGDHTEASKCLDYCETILVKAPLIINRYSSNGFESLVATSQKTKRPMVLLQAHLDVVHADDGMFTLEGIDNKLVGRGAFDMKFAAACYLYLAEELGESCKDLDFGIMFTTDEEDGGRNGVKYLLDLGYGSEVCILPDGIENWRIESAAKGLWHLDATASGVSAHGSRPWDGDNAADKILSFLREAKKYGAYKSHTDVTVEVTRLRAGHANNQIPDTAMASLDIRFTTIKQYTEIHEQITALLEKHDLEVTYESFNKNITLDVTLPLVREWERVVSAVRGVNAENGYALSFGASDARFFSEYNIPTIVTGPEGGDIHSDHEWIDEASLYQFCECLRMYLDEVAKKGSSKARRSKRPKVD